MRGFSGIVLLVLVLTLALLGCGSWETVPTVALSELPAWVGKRVVIEGCLRFSCPQVPGAVYPQDCHVFLQESESTVHLEFPQGGEDLRRTLDGYYEASFTGCVLVRVEGRVMERSCNVPGCVPWIFLEVVRILGVQEMRP
ncbi:hypothetical protein ACP6EK_04530 [Candidatus Caldatribacterium sp. SIUC1]|uniref:hypothetical protein n=1 Tax=Candidatus Caldatribacterium sp. SIUC1 TaxID=3418365 RepID=UPI003F68E06B